MTNLIIDASVAAKWYLRDESEPLVREALQILEGYVRGDLQLLVSDLFWDEIGNIFWKSVRQGRQTKSQAEAALVSLHARQFPTVPSHAVLNKAFGIATRFGRSFYDSLYIATAQRFQSKLVTADEKLARAVAAELPVEWLGAVMPF
jgi:predicted nucleic acid-binding protein